MFITSEDYLTTSVGTLRSSSLYNFYKAGGLFKVTGFCGNYPDLADRSFSNRIYRIDICTKDVYHIEFESGRQLYCLPDDMIWSSYKGCSVFVRYILVGDRFDLAPCNEFPSIGISYLTISCPFKDKSQIDEFISHNNNLLKSSTLSQRKNFVMSLPQEFECTNVQLMEAILLSVGANFTILGNKITFGAQRLLKSGNYDIVKSITEEKSLFGYDFKFWYTTGCLYKGLFIH